MKQDIAFLQRKASITSSGAILLGSHFVCDGFDWDREVAIVTHIHADHITHFERCLGVYDFIFCSPETKELLITLKGNWLRLRRNLIVLPYKKPYTFKDERITLYPAKHILGSSQVLVEDRDGIRIAYTGDFNLPSTKPISTDILVLDATFGDPAQIARCSRDDIIDRLICLVKKELDTSSVCILAHRGKLQEVMGILSEMGISVPFLCAPDIYKVSMVYQNYGTNVGNVLSLEDNAAQEIIQKGERHIIFHLFGRRLQLLPKEIHYTKIRISRWGTKEPYYTIADDYYIVALSDHADFNGTLEYVRECKPKLVITDNYRAGSADSLATEIRNQLHVEAKPMP